MPPVSPTQTSADAQRDAAADPDWVIRFDHVSKCYRLRKQRPFLAREFFRRLLRRSAHWEELWALRDVDFTVRHGESVALVGPNGAGKSTLLGTIAGTVHPTSGRLSVRGRIAALLELGAGFHPDLTGRENIYLNASLLGLDRNDIETRFASIVDFSELAEFIDVPLGQYSSGMQARLGFAVAIHIDPDILILDEVLAVGDQAFQKKCQERILGMRSAGKTILVVSHGAPGSIDDLCNRAIWIDHGRVRADGSPADVVAAYADA